MRGICILYKKFKESLIVSDYILIKCYFCLKVKKEKKKIYVIRFEFYFLGFCF